MIKIRYNLTKSYFILGGVSLVCITGTMDNTYFEFLNKDIFIHILININNQDIKNCLDLFPMIRDPYLWKVKLKYDLSDIFCHIKDDLSIPDEITNEFINYYINLVNTLQEVVRLKNKGTKLDIIMHISTFKQYFENTLLYNKELDQILSLASGGSRYYESYVGITLLDRYCEVEVYGIYEFDNSCDHWGLL